MKDAFISSSTNMMAIIFFNITVGCIGIFLYGIDYIFEIISLYFILSTLFNIGIHRYFAHNAYKTNKFWHFFLLITSPLVAAGSPISFTVAHLPHHKFTDNALDPLGKNIGILNTFLFNFNLNKNNSTPIPKRLLNDKVGIFIHRYYVLLFFVYYAFICLISFEAAFIFSASNILLLIMYCMTNYTSHSASFLNYRNFNTNDNSYNNIIHGLLGSEWHNNHHNCPGAWNQKIKWWEFDLSSFFIKWIKL